jgi:hypothetical protein
MTTPIDNQNYTVVFEHLTAIAAGMKSSWPPGQQTIVIDQQAYTPAQFEAKIDSALAPFQGVVDARTVLRTALRNRADALPGAEKLVSAFYAVLPQYIGSNNADQEKFGKQPPKARAPRTAEQKAEAAAKAKATRAARHTMGKNQKKAIKGQVPPPAATPKQGA